VRFATERYCDNPLIVQGRGRACGNCWGVFGICCGWPLPGSTNLSQRTVATAFAPASVGNVAIGFDILGFSVNAIGDRATVRRMDRLACASRHPRRGA